ncbi:rhodanese-like domain-containing protein [Streptomyces sp. WMMB 322]|uniref:rhodanese-like domain-containing protein n=1 Tax=Streptomyces sp. WMMB 322 TaxID=1286821 RepID=UPI0006E32331|nr:rhodanese-like domain-containing protein [Streptomyces sp. WMMB 322]SCK15930.1 Rhodanese-related sulfurtransferase [Streptomyces sp. WMMB 322]
MFSIRSGPGRITAAEAHERTKNRDPAGPVLLDVRETSEWTAGHATGAVHAPLPELLDGAPLPTAARGRPVVAVCRSGRRSQKAAELLAERGIDAVDVIGGMQAWTEAGLPVDDGRGGSGATA